MTQDAQVTHKAGSFYGWVAVFGTMLVFFSGQGSFFYSYGVFLSTMSDELGWSKAAMGAGLSVALVVFGLVSPIAGKSIARFGPRANIILGNFIICLGYGAMSLTTQIGHLYAFYGLMAGLGAGLGMFMAPTTVVNNWFVKKRTLAMGMMMAAGGLGGLAFPPLVTLLVSSIGWQLSWAVLGGIHMLLAVIVGGLVLIRDTPETMGQVPDGVLHVSLEGQEEAKIKEQVRASTVYQSPIDWSVKQAMASPALWLIATLGAVNYFASAVVTGHQVAHLRELGFSPMVAAVAFSLVPAMSLVGRLGFGALAIRFEIRQLAIACCVAQITAFAVLLLAKDLPMICIYAVLFGVAHGGLFVAGPSFLGAYYGRAHYAEILGMILPLGFILEAVGPVLAGGIFDTTGTYLPGFGMLIATSFIGLACAIFARPPALSK